jgi:hypothetical protein
VGLTGWMAIHGGCMNAMKACELLVQRLEELSAGANRAKRRSVLRHLDRVGGAEKQKLQQMLGSMASGMSEALGDIVERLARLDSILRVLEPADAESSAPPPRSARCHVDAGDAGDAIARPAPVRSRHLRNRHRQRPVDPRLRHGR